MFDTIVLLTGPAEQSILASVLRGHNPNLTVIPIGTAAELAALEPALLRRARLVAFTTLVIVPQNILAQLGHGAYNFHPGPPRYPGLAPAQFALYDNAAEFGATMHKMVARVDAGPIVGVVHFPVPAGINIPGLEGMAYARLAHLFWQHARALATQAASLPELPIRWGYRRSSRASLRAICDIPLDITKDELDRRIRAFGFNLFGIVPTIRLHGMTFQAVLPSSPADTRTEAQFSCGLQSEKESDIAPDSLRRSSAR